MSLLNSGKIQFAYSDEPKAETPTFETRHTAIQMFPVMDTEMWRVEVWSFDPELGYNIEHHVLIDSVTTDSSYSAIRGYIIKWIESNYDKSHIFKELSK